MFIIETYIYIHTEKIHFDFLEKETCITVAKLSEKAVCAEC